MELTLWRDGVPVEMSDASGELDVFIVEFNSSMVLGSGGKACLKLLVLVSPECMVDVVGLRVLGADIRFIPSCILKDALAACSISA